MNPGGSHFFDPVPSVEAGNAYRVETDWGASGPRHQEQVRSLYEELARRLDRDNGALLMDKTLASNFCPFRSPSWPVSNKERSVAFSFELWRHVWRYVVGHVERPVVICNGKHAFRYFGGVVERQGGRRIGGESDFIGWGDQTYEVARYGTAVLAAVPHLSRYRIFGRPNPGTWSITSSRPSPRRSMSN